MMNRMAAGALALVLWGAGTADRAAAQEVDVLVKADGSAVATIRSRADADVAEMDRWIAALKEDDGREQVAALAEELLLAPDEARKLARELTRRDRARALVAWRRMEAEGRLGELAEAEAEPDAPAGKGERKAARVVREIDDVKYVAKPFPHTVTVVKYSDVNTMGLDDVFDDFLPGKKSHSPLRYAEGELAIRFEAGPYWGALVTLPDPAKPPAAGQAVAYEYFEQPVRLTVRVDGEITETNARHADRRNGAVTLLALDPAAVAAAHRDRAADLLEIGRLAAAEPMAARFEKLVPGTLIEDKPEIVVHFQ